jgi:hypothetical protein
MKTENDWSTPEMQRGEEEQSYKGSNFLSDLV